MIYIFSYILRLNVRICLIFPYNYIIKSNNNFVSLKITFSYHKFAYLVFTYAKKYFDRHIKSRLNYRLKSLKD